MKDTFNMGYDLQQAGFDFAAVHQRENHNIELLKGIAEDFVKVTDQKAGIKCDKEAITCLFYESAPNAAEPVMILYVNAEAKLGIKFINRSNPLFRNLFVEESAKI